MSDPPGYPRELERDLVLKDGAGVHIRPIRPDDAPRLMSAYERLSARSAYQRFFSVRRRLPPDWAQFLATVDYRRRLALIAERPAGAEAELPGAARVGAEAELPGAARVGAEAELPGAARVGAEAELLAVARYEPSEDDAAEVAFVVLDAWQGRGLGTALFRALLDAARARGIRRFRAWVLADNARMLDLIHRHGAVEAMRRDGPVVELIFTS